MEEVIGQDHIATVLKNSIKNGKLSHAYLFTGPRGVGKTSVARILAKNVNGLKQDDTNFYPDIIEIDAASNRRIEEIRELRDKIAIAPSQLKYKVYIIDEVHMLTREAFNALLKTLEEPPEHAIFILATTDFHKVPDTISSRCIRLNFKLITNKDLSSSLKVIAMKENIDIDDEALVQIAEFSEGSFRDALSLLDQMSALKQKIDVKSIELSLGIANKHSLAGLVDSIDSGNTSIVFSQIQDMLDAGATPDQINRQLSAILRSSLQNNNSKLPSSQAISLIENLNSMYSYQDQRIALELAILKVIQPKDIKPTTEHKEMNTEEVLTLNEAEVKKTDTEPAKPEVKIVAQKFGEATKLWQAVLDNLKNQNNTLYSIARMAEPSMDNNRLDLAFKFPFHLKQMHLQKNKNLIEEILASVNAGVSLNIIESSTNKKPEKPPAKFAVKKSSDDLKSISNIFGSAEVLES